MGCSVLNIKCPLLNKYLTYILILFNELCGSLTDYKCVPIVDTCMYQWCSHGQENTTSENLDKHCTSRYDLSISVKLKYDLPYACTPS